MVEIRRGGIRHQVQPRVKSAFALHAAADLKDHDIPVAAILQAMADLFARLTKSGYSGYTLAEIPANDDPERLLRYYKALWDAYQL